jgi:DnaJ family protein A protein 5
LRKGRASARADDGYTVDDLMPFFDTSAFKGYGDDEKGFFAVYRNLFAFFEDLEEEAAEENSRMANTRHVRSTFANFGSKNTPYEPSLKAFYDKFLHFSSVRPFYEADNYDDSCAENRRHRRAIDKENQRYRDAMRKEFNDTLRNLAAWVRKRDPRWHEFQAKRSAAREAAEARRKEEVTKRRAEQAESYVAPEWAVDHQMDEEYLLQQLKKLQFEDEADADKSHDSSDLDSEEDFYCTVCKKVFRNHQQWKNHERSKKHRTSMLKAGFSLESSSEDELEEELHEEDEMPLDKEARSSESELELEEEEFVKVESKEMGQKPPKKKNRQNKKQQPEAKTPKKKKESKKDALDADSPFQCQVCRAAFDSRNKLFKHIDDEGHATLKKKK